MRRAAGSLAALVIAGLGAAGPSAGESARPLPPVIVEAVADIQRGISELRGREFLSPVKLSVMSGEQFAAYVERRLEEEYPPDKLAREQIAFEHFGFLAPGEDLGSIFVDLVTGQAAGFYDPDRKELYLVEGTTFAGKALVHEIVHALQDQHFGLRRMLDDAKSNDDRLKALQALIEGEATALSIEYSRAHPVTSRQEEALRSLAGPPREEAETLDRLREFPEMLQRDLLFPYTTGREWARRLKHQGGSELMDRMYRQPPESTEQVLHLEEGREPDRPSIIDEAGLPDLASRGFRTIKTNTLGEFLLRELLGNGTDPDAAASGWDGDLYRIYESSAGATAMIWLTAWDTAGDAEEFVRSVGAWLDRRHRPGSGGDRVARGGPEGRIVRVIQGFDEGLAAELDAAMLEASDAAVRLR